LSPRVGASAGAPARRARAMLPFPADIAYAELSAPPGGSGVESGLLPEERDLLSPQAIPKRRIEFALGRRCARESMMRLGVEGARRLPVLRHGPRRPHWPEGLVGAITHSGDRAAAAVGWAVSAAGRWRWIRKAPTRSAVAATVARKTARNVVTTEE